MWFTNEINPDQASFKVGGATDLRLPLAMAITSRPDAIIIISDDYENQSSGSVRCGKIGNFFLSPQSSCSKRTATRTLAKGIELMAIGDIKQFLLAALMAQFKQNSELLTAHLDRIYQALLLGNVRRAKAIASLTAKTTVT